MKVSLATYDNSWYDPGRSFAVRSLWHVVNALILQNSLNPSSSLRVRLLRMFGAKIGNGVICKPGINIKYPWHLEIGDYSWIGEKVWIDSLAPVSIGAHACISQDAYLCTGNHDWSDPSFGLIVKPIVIEDGAWIGARATILPGVVIATHAVIAAGSVVTKRAEPYTIYAGNPAQAVKPRELRSN